MFGVASSAPLHPKQRRPFPTSPTHASWSMIGSHACHICARNVVMTDLLL